MAEEQVKIKLSLSGLPAGSQITGSISILLYGLEDASFVSDESMLETTYNTTASPAVFRISVSEGAYINVRENGAWEIGEFAVKISPNGTESRFSVEAAFTDTAGEAVSVLASSYVIVRSTETPTPSPEPTQTPEPSATPSDGSAAPSPTGTSPSVSGTPDASSMSPVPTEGTPDATHTPAPTDPPATMTVIQTASPSGSESPSDGSQTADTTGESGGTSFPSLPTQDPGSGRTEPADNTISVGAIIFWSITALILGIWIGIVIGAFIWRKKSVFMTAAEKKIIGRF